MSTDAGPTARTAAALAARRRSTQAALDRVGEAITRSRRDKTPITVAAISRRAGVSRTFCYENTAARAAIASAVAETDQPRGQALTAHDEQQEATWCQRALNAEDALATANSEILTQRTRISELLGHIRDLEADWSQEATQRVHTENTTLKQRVRQLTSDNRTLDERLAAARSNLRFQDRRIADLEARIADPSSTS